jgi:hypothetical protein
LDFDRTIEELKQAAADLEALQGSVGKFADWWVTMNGKLSTADTRAEALDAAKKKKLQIKGLQKGWKAIHEDYVIYNVKVRIILFSTFAIEEKLDTLADR